MTLNYAGLSVEQRSLADNIISPERQLLAAKERFNATTPPMRLPTELLLYILKIYRDSWLLRAKHAPTKFGTSPLRNHNAWVRITHVCAHWRRLALAYHELWARVAMYNEDCTAEFLERSANRPLAVTCHVNRNTSPRVEAILSVLQHSARIYELAVDYDRFVDEGRTWQAPSFPRLRILDLGDGDVPPFIRLTDSFNSLEEIKVKFDHLSTLELIAERSPNLVRIRLYGYTHPVTWPRLFDTLAKVAPRVQELTVSRGLPLTGGLFLGSSEIPSFAPSIPFPQLRSLVLCGTASRCAVFLHHIELPPPAALVVELRADDYFSQDMHPEIVYMSLACAAIEQVLRQGVLGTPVAFRTLQLGSYADARRHDLTIRAWKDALPMGLVHGPPGFQNERYSPPQLEVTFKGYSINRVVECFMGCIPWPDVERLFVVASLDNEVDRPIFGAGGSRMRTLSESVWRTELGRLTKLRGLSVDECGTPGLRAALLPNRSELVQVPWPALEVLQLRNVSFVDNSSVLPDNKGVRTLPESLTEEQWVQDLGSVIRARRRLGAGPRMLSVRHCMHSVAALERRLSACDVELELVPESPLYPGDSWYTPED